MKELTDNNRIPNPEHGILYLKNLQISQINNSPALEGEIT